MSFTIFSFGFRYGAPEADEVFDLRCLKNPYWEPELRELCSQDAPVRDFILHNEQSRTVLNYALSMLLLQADLYAERGWGNDMTVMQAKIEKDWRNDANRKTNCDTANVTKAVDAAQEQLAALRTLEAQGRLDSLPEKLLQTALLRREHPEATLSELAELHEPPTSKSTVNHRMRKLLALAAEGTETTEEGPA